MIEEYKRSLKMPEAEEIFDLIFYRPAGFILVRMIYKLPVAPNHISLLSMATGLLAAWQFSIGAYNSMELGGALYLISNILDCADGQLARLQKSGTLLGRVIDGAADYIAGAAVFLGLGVGLGMRGDPSWFLIIAAGVSTAVHAMFFDHYQSEFISSIRGGGSFIDAEMRQFQNEIHRMRKENRDGLKRFLLVFYLKYLGIQRRSSSKSSSHKNIPYIYRKENSVMMRLWNFLGPTTNRTLLVIFAFIGNIHLYLWIIVIAGNLWLIFSFLMQRRIHRKLGMA